MFTFGRCAPSRPSRCNLPWWVGGQFGSIDFRDGQGRDGRVEGETKRGESLRADGLE